MLSLGVPGSGTTAVMLAMLISLNVSPGPLLFERQPELVWGLVASLYMANVALLILNLPMIGLFTRLIMVPTWALMPIVAAVSFVGVFSISNSVFDLEMMILFGALGYLLRKMDVSLVPLVLGLLLGGDMERNLRRALSISDGDWGVLIASPISVALYVLTAGFLALSVWLALRDHKRQQERATEGLPIPQTNLEPARTPWRFRAREAGVPGVVAGRSSTTAKPGGNALKNSIYVFDLVGFIWVLANW